MAEKNQMYDVLLASRRRIPRGCRTKYVPGITDPSKRLYEVVEEMVCVVCVSIVVMDVFWRRLSISMI